ncbi:MAG TPA: GspE/PulE family protein [Acidimicrobiales bacterium]|nr:GspE/PulE family protein [Acidimicrobiales bacterium]
MKLKRRDPQAEDRVTDSVDGVAPEDQDLVPVGAATRSAQSEQATVRPPDPFQGLGSMDGSPGEDAGKTGRHLGDVLVLRNLATRDQIQHALDVQAETGGRLGEILVETGVLDERGLVEGLAAFFGMPVADLRRTKPEPDALALIPEAIARENQAVPIRIDSDGLHVAVAEPSDQLRFHLAETAGRPVRLLIAPLSDIAWAIDNSYLAIGGVAQLVQAFEVTEGSRKKTTEVAATETIADNAPVVQVVDRILTQAMRDRASDVHIEPADDVVRVRFRIDGALKEILILPAAIGLGLVSRIKIMAGMNIVERRRPQDGQLTTVVDGKDIDVRVATVATIWGENCVMRILDKTRSVLRLGDLGMPTDTHAKYSKLVRAPFGMVLCAGPTGSGKTTTLYATLTEVNNPTLNIMTIEDPVEYVFPSINQIQTNDQAGLTFATGLKAILRQDPDVILVGEIRDVETARVAVQSALTGHFVVSSMHATDACSALHRFLDMGIESFLIASSVLAVVGQRLVRRICPSCKTTYTPTEEELAFYEDSGGPPKEVFYHGTGCNFCSETGYQERIGVYEVLEMTPEIRRLIVGWATQEELRNLAQKQGMRTLRQEATSLVAQDITTVAEVIRSMYTL